MRSGSCGNESEDRTSVDERTILDNETTHHPCLPLTDNMSVSCLATMKTATGNTPGVPSRASLVRNDGS